MRQKPSQNML